LDESVTARIHRFRKEPFIMDFQPSYKEFASIFKALSDETRLRVVDMLSCREMSAGDILSNFTLSQSTLSYHMKILIESGVVNARREGLWTKYSINDETFNRTMDFLPELYKLKDKCVCQQIKYVKNPERQELGGADEFGN
jgi:ArsR family transcriptional regulator